MGRVAESSTRKLAIIIVCMVLLSIRLTGTLVLLLALNRSSRMFFLFSRFRLTSLSSVFSRFRISSPMPLWQLMLGLCRRCYVLDARCNSCEFVPSIWCYRSYV